MPSADFCWYISFPQLYRSEYMLAGRVPGLGERQETTLHRKNGTADKSVILAWVVVHKDQDWKGSLCFVLNGVMTEDLDKNLPFRVVKQIASL